MKDSKLDPKIGELYEDKFGKEFEVVEYYSPFIKFVSLETGQYCMLDDTTMFKTYKKVDYDLMV